MFIILYYYNIFYCITRLLYLLFYDLYFLLQVSFLSLGHILFKPRGVEHGFPPAAFLTNLEVRFNESLAERFRIDVKSGLHINSEYMGQGYTRIATYLYDFAHTLKLLFI